MKTSLVAAGTATLAALLLCTTAFAKPPKGAVPGTFTVNVLAQGQLASYMHASDVFCVWSKGHVMVHVDIKNAGAEHVTATINPRYTIARGGTHGDGLTNGKNYGFDGGGFRALWIDAGAPDGVKANSAIATCQPYLLLVKSG